MSGVRTAATVLAALVLLAGFGLIAAYLASGGTVDPRPVAVVGLDLPAGFPLTAAGIIGLVLSTPPRQVS
ncbi:hypothetical protein ABZ949_02050 [Micromonospora tulbaghiae]|uniref:hypothetical protein n=1 Tax=Micromonospora tulbaghiae TaxID=479978 RepID=UPI0033C5DEBF